MTLPVTFQRVENAVILIAVVLIYGSSNCNWLLFALLLLVPDLSMIGYLRNPSAGAVVYNIGHSYALPVALLAISLLLSSGMLMQLALIWTAHIAMDRTLGYGLKLHTGFHDTHLGHIGK